MEIAQLAGFARLLHVVVRNLPGVLIRRRGLAPIAQARENVRRHVIRVRNRGGGLRVHPRRGKTSFCMHRIVVPVNEVVEHAGVLLVVRVDGLEELDRLALHLESLRPFPDRSEDRKAVEQLGLVVRIFRVGGSHLVPIALVT